MAGKRPASTEWGGKWVTAPFSQTQNTESAIGDFRGILLRQVPVWDLQQIEQESGSIDQLIPSSPRHSDQQTLLFVSLTHCIASFYKCSFPHFLSHRKYSPTPTHFAHFIPLCRKRCSGHDPGEGGIGSEKEWEIGKKVREGQEGERDV